jgi:thiamine biosynthesis lipoprotein
LALRRQTADWPALGSVARLTCFVSGPEQFQRALVVAKRRVAELDAILSDYKPDSELNRLCRAAFHRTVRVSRELFTVLEMGQRMSVLTGGAFDITVGARTRGRSGNVGYQFVALGVQSVRLAKPDMQFDLGGLAKGFIGDEVSRALDAIGVRRHLVALSGDIVLGDAPPDEEGWKIGLGSKNVVRTLERKGISTAGNTFQPGHIVDARTGERFLGKDTVTVVAPDGLTADALDTALLLLEKSQWGAVLAAFPGAEVAG